MKTRPTCTTLTSFNRTCRSKHHYNLKSNLVFKTLSKEHAKRKSHSIDFIPDILFMCVSKERLLQLCSLFPQTAENIKRKSLERRQRFMQQKNTNSKAADR